MQELDLILYGDSIFESILGTSVGHKIGRARGIPEVWSRYRGTSARKVLSITGTCLPQACFCLHAEGLPLLPCVGKCWGGGGFGGGGWRGVLSQL